MLVTPKNGTACLTFTLVTVATAITHLTKTLFIVRAFLCLILLVRQPDARAYRQNVRLRSWLVLVVKTDRAIRPKVVGVTRLGRMPSFDSVGSSASHHFTFSIDDRSEE